MKSALVMQTDFGVDNLSVATMRGVAMIVDPELRVFDATHAINQFDVLAASDALIYTIPFWPEGTVFVSVVDPGVGTARKSCVAKLSNGSYIVTPDNGTLTYVKERIGIVAVREIDESVNRYPTTRNIHIFHGRDVYAYCGARLAAGVIDFEGVGPEYSVDDIVMAPYVHPEKQENAVYGMIIEATEHFGLVGTNIPFEWLKEKGMEYGDNVRLTIKHNDEVILDEEVALGKVLRLCSAQRKAGVQQRNGLRNGRTQPRQPYARLFAGLRPGMDNAREQNIRRKKCSVQYLPHSPITARRTAARQR